MLKKLSIENFKCYETQYSFDFPGLTILTGANNSGKSTVLQSILLPMVSFRSLPGFETLLLNTDYNNFVSFSDILNKNKPSNTNISFSFNLEGKKFEICDLKLEYGQPNSDKERAVASLQKLKFKYNNNLFTLKKQNTFYSLEESHTNNTIQVWLKGQNLVPTEKKELHLFIENGLFFEIQNFFGFINSFVIDHLKYLRAYRDDPKYTYGMKGNISNDIGFSGSNIAEVLYKNQDLQVTFNKEYKFKELFNQWCSKIIEQDFIVSSVPYDNQFYKLKVKDKSDCELDLFQVGFGISQIIPIITMILLSDENDVLLIENPEVHLHPKLQSNLADLFVFALKHNRKLIIETHSEHIINKTRLLVKKSSSAENLTEKINIYFFEKELNSIKQTEVKINKAGKISEWPKNFFDQSYIDSIGLMDDDEDIF